MAISILSVSILAGFTAVQNGLKSSQTAKNQMIAFYLVQEAMEHIKNRRDTNALDFINGGSSTWLTGLSACSSPSVCYIDAPADTVTACSGVNSTCPNMVIKTATGLYGYNAAGVTTNFKRAITYQSVSADEVTVTIWISWTQGIATKSSLNSTTISPL